MVEFDQLKTLLTLNGGKRLKDIEHDIFTDTRPDVIWYYLSKLEISCYPLHDAVVCQYDAERVIFFYSTVVLEERWIAAESVFLPATYWCKRYRNYYLLDHMESTDTPPKLA